MPGTIDSASRKAQQYADTIHHLWSLSLTLLSFSQPSKQYYQLDDLSEKRKNMCLDQEHLIKTMHKCIVKTKIRKEALEILEVTKL